ncbi:MAG: S-layer homology domain-containing protein [Oscillospiraceae bacterium]|nr:S-layer homology domain-containing protein [Oscillospiraceae bacterium]
MKRLLSTITALSLLTASTVGAGASWLGSELNSAFYGAALQAEETVSPMPTTAAATEKPSDKPTEIAADKPTEVITEKPTEVPTATPAATAEPTATPVTTETPTATPVVTETPTVIPEVTSEPKITSLTLDKQNLQLKKGESFKLTAKTEPENVEDVNIVWSVSSDSKSVTVDSSGNVTATAAGSAIVSAMDEDTKLIASCFIIVEEEDGIIDLSVTDGVKEVIITKDGENKEISAGKNHIAAGTYSVSATSYEGYTLKAYSETVTVEKDKETHLSVQAEKTSCEITVPQMTGVTITPVNGSKSPVELNGSYSFTLSLGSSYDSTNLVVKANGVVISPVEGVYTISDIKDDVVITIDGIEVKSWDATLKSVKVKDYTAVLGSDNTYTVTVPYGDKVSISDISVVVNDSKSEYTITSEDGQYIITVKAEDGTTNVYKLSVTVAEATVIDQFKVAIATMKFSDVTQSSSGSYDSQESVKDSIKKKIDSIADEYQGVKYTIENGEVKAPVKGTLASPTGQDGYYKFTVTLTSDTVATAEESTRTIDLTININGYDYSVAVGNITVTTTIMTIKNLDSSSEVGLFSAGGTRVRQWTTPTNGTVTFSNLSGGETYVVKMRAQGSDEVPATGTRVTMQETKTRGTSKYYTVTFDEGAHGTIVSGKARQTVKLTGIADYPVVKADEGYVFKGWSANGVLIENPKTYYIRCATSFTAIYEVSNGSTVSSSSRPSSDSTLYNYTNSSDSKSYAFSDVPATSWYYNSVTNICNKGYMNGVSDTRFEPDSTLTRAMLVTILYRYASEPNVDFASNFSDVPGGQWYSDAVAWASDAGIVNGTSEGRFDPDSNITREQLAAIMYRYCEAFGYDTSAAGNIIKYNDSAKISDWAQTALIWTTGAGIMEGKDGNVLDPQGNATRAEAAAIIERFDNFVSY